jgi:hypothetical protein
MSICANCSRDFEDDSLLSGTDVYGELASGNDRADILATYDGIRYGRETVICAECLDTPTDCRECGGTGDVQTTDGGTERTESCPECDGTGTAKPDLLRTCCK